MASIVSAGATLSCTLGTSTSKLEIPGKYGSGVHGKTPGVISDRIVNKNIMPFNMCTKTIPPVPCSPVICMDWVNGKKDIKIKNEMALIDICIVPCMMGGIIKIVSSGQE